MKKKTANKPELPTFKEYWAAEWEKLSRPEQVLVSSIPFDPNKSPGACVFARLFHDKVMAAYAVLVEKEKGAPSKPIISVVTVRNLTAAAEELKVYVGGAVSGRFPAALDEVVRRAFINGIEDALTNIAQDLVEGNYTDRFEVSDAAHTMLEVMQ